jgi:hypothetical protein
VIRNVVIHITNEQPLMADLFEMPSPGDISLICTNIRSLDGKKPIFIDHAASTFVFPYLNLRFVEIMPGSTAAVTDEPSTELVVALAEPQPMAIDEPDLEIDEDFLRRIRDV